MTNSGSYLIWGLIRGWKMTFTFRSLQRRGWIVLGVVIFSCGCISGLSFSACLSCWQLKGVAIELKDGQSVSGHMLWHRDWLAGKKSHATFPDAIFDLADEIRTVIVYTDLRAVKFPANRVVALRAGLSIPIQDIKELAHQPGSFENHEGAGALPVVSPRIADLLQKDPVAFCHCENPVADIYWISYNQGISEKDLACLCRKPWMNLVENSKNLEINNRAPLKID